VREVRPRRVTTAKLQAVIENLLPLCKALEQQELEFMASCRDDQLSDQLKFREMWAGEEGTELRVKLVQNHTAKHI
jgi:hypothetical protein